jgi:O-Antigen ligase
MREIPDRLLFQLLLWATFIYFIWPRYAFIPISALPIKHPQKMLHIALIGVFIYCLIKCAPLRERLRERIQLCKPLFWAWAGLALWQLLSVGASDVPFYSFSRWLIDFQSIYLYLPLGLACIPGEKQARTLIAALVAAAAINGVYALAETAIHRSIFERFQTLSMVDPVLAKQIVMAKIRGGSYRAQASFDHPILFAEFLAFVLPFAVCALFKEKIQLRYVLAIGLILLGLVLSKSRTAAVGAVIGGLGALILMMRHAVRSGQIGAWVYPTALIVSPILLGGAYIAFNELTSIAMGRTGAEASSTTARFDMLVAGLKLVLSSPLLGYGIGLGGNTLNFQNGEGVVTLDNYYLLLTLDSGLPAFILFISTLIGISRIKTKSTSIELASAAIPALIFFGLSKIILGTYLNNHLLPLLAAIMIAASISNAPKAFTKP